MTRIVAMARLAAGCLLLAMAWASPLAAQNSTPDLIGTWVLVAGETRTTGGLLDEKKSGVVELEITEQSEGTFAGKYRWDVPARQGELNDGKTETTMSEETFIGVISWDGTSFIMVDYPDTSIRMGRFVNAHTIETILVESGPYAFVARQMYVRKE